MAKLDPSQILEVIQGARFARAGRGKEIAEGAYKIVAEVKEKIGSPKEVVGDEDLMGETYEYIHKFINAELESLEDCFNVILYGEGFAYYILDGYDNMFELINQMAYEILEQDIYAYLENAGYTIFN